MSMNVSGLGNSHKVNFGNDVKNDPVDTSVKKDVPADSFNNSALPKNDKAKEPPQISGARRFFGRLTTEQIKQVNECGRLPDNAKFRKGRVVINWFNITRGTQILPKDMELKKGIFGFTMMVYKGTKGLLVRDPK